MKQALFFLFLFLVLACQNEPTAIEEEPTFEIANNQVAWSVNGKRISPPQVRGFLFQHSNYYQLDISAMEGSAGLLLILVTDKKDLKGNYSLQQVDKDGIPFSKTSIKMNTLDQGLLSVYISEDCNPVEGFIAIEEYDETNQTISGRFEVKLCTNGRFGKVDDRMLRSGQFEKIAIKANVVQ